MARANYPSIDFVRQCLREENGKLYWLKRPRSTFNNPDYADRVNKQFAGKEAGCVSEIIQENGKIDKRWVIRINAIKMYRYQIIWALHKNEWINSSSIDHENRNSLDDRIENLRPASMTDQCGNCGKRSHNTTGYKGVTYDKRRKKYLAQIRKKGVHVHGGCFDNTEEAHAKYVEMATKYFGEFACDGKDT